MRENNNPDKPTKLKCKKCQSTNSETIVVVDGNHKVVQGLMTEKIISFKKGDKVQYSLTIYYKVHSLLVDHLTRRRIKQITSKFNHHRPYTVLGKLSPIEYLNEYNLKKNYSV